MDYIFGSTLRLVAVALVLISYDITCQWFTNLLNRINHWPLEIAPSPRISFVPAIPKLHEPMHQSANHQCYSLNYIPGVGASDCECPERVWGSHNALGNSTKTQGPGSRQDVLDDHFGFWNWLKYVMLGKTLSRRYKNAIINRNNQREGFRGLSDSVESSVIKKWEKICLEWEEDLEIPKKMKNPYQGDETSKCSSFDTLAAC